MHIYNLNADWSKTFTKCLTFEQKLKHEHDEKRMNECI